MQKRKAKNYSKQSEYHEKTTRNLLETDTFLIAISEAYYAMMHKANQALALAGYDIGSHRCTVIGLSRILNRSDLAETLRRAGDRRLETDYELELDSPPYTAEETKKFVEQTMKEFLREVEKLIRDLSRDPS